MTENAFVAIRKSPNDESAALRDAPVDERRAQLLDSARRSTHLDMLVRRGFEYSPSTNTVKDSETSSETYGYSPLPEDKASVRRLGNVGAYFVNAPDKNKKREAIDLLQDDYTIIPDIRLSIPSVTLKDRSARLAARPWPAESGIPDALTQGIKGSGVRIGVLDTGCDADHVQFQNKTIDFLYVNPTNLQHSRHKRAFDTDTHGTHVSGIIVGNNVGVAPDAELMVASVIESEGAETSLDRILFALDWMLSTFEEPENRSKPMVINLSLGFRTEQMSQRMQRTINSAMRSLLRRLLDDFQVLTIAAIGNDGPGIVRAPGYFGEVVGVGAVDYQLKPYAMSGGGESPDRKRIKPDITGFGVDIYSALERDSSNRNFYGLMTGTSMATPYVAGIAALYASAASAQHTPLLQGTALRDKLLTTALPLPRQSKDRVGAGLARFVLDRQK